MNTSSTPSTRPASTPYVDADPLDALLLRALFRSDAARAWVCTVGIGCAILADAALRPVFAWLVAKGSGNPGRKPLEVQRVLEQGGNASLADYIINTTMRPEWAMRDVQRVAAIRARHWMPEYLRDVASHVAKQTDDGKANAIIEHTGRVFQLVASCAVIGGSDE
jgi:hypothetical protein